MHPPTLFAPAAPRPLLISLLACSPPHQAARCCIAPARGPHGAAATGSALICTVPAASYTLLLSVSPPHRVSFWDRLPTTPLSTSSLKQGNDRVFAYCRLSSMPLPELRPSRAAAGQQGLSARAQGGKSLFRTCRSEGTCSQRQCPWSCPGWSSRWADGCQQASAGRCCLDCAQELLCRHTVLAGSRSASSTHSSVSTKSLLKHRGHPSAADTAFKTLRLSVWPENCWPCPRLVCASHCKQLTTSAACLALPRLCLKLLCAGGRTH